jgi:hypothetical protein
MDSFEISITELLVIGYVTATDTRVKHRYLQLPMARIKKDPVILFNLSERPLINRYARLKQKRARDPSRDDLYLQVAIALGQQAPRLGRCLHALHDAP